MLSGSNAAVHERGARTAKMRIRSGDLGCGAAAAGRVRRVPKQRPPVVLLSLGMTSVYETPPPDDSGSDAFQRYAYQAHVAFPFCLSCYFVGDVVSIYCEHWEDLLVEYVDRLRFTQIKTRDGGRGPWRYTHLLEENGALRSLLRTHLALEEITVDRPIEYDVRLEGAVDSGDREIRRLLVGGDGANDEMCERCATRLEINAATARALLDRVTVRPDQPSRTLIAGRNRDSLRLPGGHLTAGELGEIYESVINLVKRAMEADLLADAWPQAVLEPASAEELAAQRAQAKRIARELLQPILSRLEGGDQPLLEAITDPDRLLASALEFKLATAGASPQLVARAKQFRAQAAIRVAELRGRSLYDVEAVMGDLHLRILDAAESVAETVQIERPAAEVWNQLGLRLSANPSAYDPRGVLSQDHLLLLGEVCQLSDECKFRWGVNA